MSTDQLKVGATTRSRPAFFVVYASVCFLILVAGFGRSFFFRSAFESEPLPLIVFTHGVVFTAWFALFLAQSLLVANRRTDLHRRLGILGCAIAIVAIIIFVPTAVGFYPRRAALGINVTNAVQTAQILRDSIGFAAFPAFVFLAIWLRRRAEAHKRLMLLATISLLPPALSRMIGLPVVSELPGGPLRVLALLVVLLAVPVVYDIVVRKRIHPVLAWGAPLYFLWLIGALVVARVVSAQ